MRQIKFAVTLPSRDFAETRAMAESAEALGFHAISLDDHFFMRGLMETRQTPRLECYMTLATLAGLTRRVRLVQTVTSMSYRNPALLAKMTSTLDHISGGRLTVGVGAGWFREEYQAYNYPYLSNAERIEQLAEGIKVLKLMWTEDEPSWQGRYFKIAKAYNYPKPVQKPHPPLLVGGSGNEVLKITAAEADIANLIPPFTRGELDLSEALKFDKTELGRRIETLRGYAKAAGRSPDSIRALGQQLRLGRARQKRGRGDGAGDRDSDGGQRYRGGAPLASCAGRHGGGGHARAALANRNARHHLLLPQLPLARHARALCHRDNARVRELSSPGG